MTIEILPAQLANQIAAGEVVERPASVVKELVENSLDAGATSIKIDIEKGGAKRIRISDNGKGIVKDELTLALSRHATSKIKNLNDLEGINSLGFRGEALASISSVARLTLTSKPKEQESAWQACAQGRDMDVAINPAAHSDGTTIDVMDLFFNTPARRKFMRTEKTEFSHIEEVIKRIALARFDVAFTLTHNHKVVRQYRLANTANQKAKRVAQVCGQAFIDNALQVDCQHDGLSLTGWIANPQFNRKQNDLCYSYVNGRMMRDKLINHAIRQSFHEMLPDNTYPAFVLFLTLDVRDVDVNVHPAKHEVRFHQGRYVHDFIYSVCHQALMNELQSAHQEQDVTGEADNFLESQLNQSAEQHIPPVEYFHHQHNAAINSASEQVQEYVKPLSYDSNHRQTSARHYAPSTNAAKFQGNAQGLAIASKAYQTLMQPLDESRAQAREHQENHNLSQLTLQFIAPSFALYIDDNQPRLISLEKLTARINFLNITKQWPQGLTSQPLLLPIKLSFSKADIDFIESNAEMFTSFGMVIQRLSSTAIQIRQYPAMLREKDVNHSFSLFLEHLFMADNEALLSVEVWQNSFVKCLTPESFDEKQLHALYMQLTHLCPQTINQELALNSTTIDLTSSIEKLK
ncbi:DNA mismatch repair endonuclease MutL [Colwellia sp. 1_MG-2023]|uniref:DNA mismatch repair endonuclease MutL n=1 Tax=Colwellia sp. 1_MG-2023 TaxID=3062649 RepID=UPI0026E28932|nr:DNA mismatch repair endonuclease MutL [Colwellia sp. 1_MG-2023]MDO6445032.1 DNA mismatch repair endonuclease MutL [Colwellia sp. 1_MG-2023]